MKKYMIIPFVSVILFTSCNTGPKSIDYGQDGCHYCKMTIVDKIHGAEIVSKKGKVFKFDATECMLNYKEEDPDSDTGNFYTNYFEEPTDLINAKEATYLISEKMPSPMGANITAFMAKGNALKQKAEKGGILYTWEELEKLDLTGF